MRFSRCLFVIALMGAAGCANTHVYDDAGLRQESGVRYYNPKPYLFLKECPNTCCDAAVVLLPDLAHPQYVSQQAGIGSSAWTMTLSNGMLAKFDQTTDSKADETLTAATSAANALLAQLLLLKTQEAKPAPGAKTQLLGFMSAAEAWKVMTEPPPPRECCTLRVFEIRMECGKTSLVPVGPADALMALETALALPSGRVGCSGAPPKPH